MAEHVEETQDEEAIFLAAIEKPTPHERKAYLEGVCADNPELRNRVEELLDSHEDSEGPLDAPLPAIDMPPITETVGSVIGPYKLMEQIGEGGMGVVYVAEQTKPVRRKVALKIIKPGMDTKQVIARFEAERQALAMMDHPNIAKVLDAGTTETGQPYFCMELVRGLPITEYCDMNTLNTRERLELFILVCRAVQHAHQKGIIHRDLKPTNILVTLIDAVPVPKVIDFGVAKAVNQQLADHSVYTAHAQMIGTPMYMSPEQAAMTSQDVDTRSDVYSLGVLLYELLTGSTPFDKQMLKDAGFDEMRRIIREDEPPRPSDRISTLHAEALSTVSAQRNIDPHRFSRQVHGELDWIVMQALEKDRTRRYESASAFAADIERYLKDEPVEACPPSSVYRLRKLARRNKVALITTVLVVTSLFVGTGVSIWQRFEANKARRESDESHTKAEKQRRLAERLSVNLALDRGLALCEQGNPAHGLLWLARALNVASDDAGELQDVIRANLGYWSEHVVPLQQVVHLTDGVIIGSAAIDPKRGAVAAADGMAVRVWDMASGEMIGQPLRHTEKVSAVAFSHDGQTVLIGDVQGRVHFWNPRTGRVSSPEFQRSAPITTLATSAGGRSVLISSRDGHVHLGKFTTGEPLGKIIPIADLRGGDGTFSPDGKTVLTWEKVSVFLWDAHTGKPIGNKIGTAGLLVHAATISHDGESVFYVRANTAEVHSLTNGTLQGKPLQHRAHVSAVAFGPGDRYLLTGSYDRTARIWDAASHRPLGQPFEHDGELLTVDFSHNGQMLFTVCDRGVARMWPVPVDHPAPPPLPHPSVDSLAVFHLQEKSLVTFSEGTIRLWNVPDGRLTRRFPMEDGVTEMAFHPDGEQFATGNFSKLVFWKLDDETPAREVLLPAASWVFSLAFSPDGKLLFVGSRDLVYRFDTTTLAEAGTPLSHPGAIGVLVFSPDGKTLLTGGSRGSARLWDLGTGRLKSEIPANVSQLQTASFRPDGRVVVLGHKNGRVTLWDAETGRQISEALRMHREAREVVLSPDGRTLLAVGGDGSARLFDIATGRVLGASFEHYASMTSVVFSRDGHFVTTVAPDFAVRVVEVPQPIGGETERITLWAQVITGMELDDEDVPVLLNSTIWKERRNRLRRLGGTPSLESQKPKRKTPIELERSL